MKHPRPKIVISACIEHSSVRYDGTMISDEVVRKLKDFVDFLPVCPEVGIGLGSPRDTLRLVKQEDKIALVSSTKGTDHTDAMDNFSKKFINSLMRKEIDGFILKAKSPTCGTDKVKVYRGLGKAMPDRPIQNGLFADKIVTNYTTTPIETERRLSNFNIREAFFIQVFTLAAFRQVQSVKELQLFHKTNKYLFMSFHQLHMKNLGNIAANRDKKSFEEVYIDYKEKLQTLLSSPLTKQKRINVLTHIYGYFKKQLSQTEKEFYFDVQNDYLKGHIPFSVTLKILRGFIVRFDQDYLSNQTLFEPYPKDLVTQLDSGKNL